ncbi:MAG: FAD/NAD(P)-binding protein [Reyranella sp.]
MANERPRSVGIVGAGFTGTMLAVHLIELSRVPLQVILFDRTATFGNGTAYATPNAKHLLNVRVANMSAYDADPDHFVRWLDEQNEACADPPTRRAFVSRGTYGRYLRATLEAARLRAGSRSSVVEVGAEVTSLRAGERSVELASADGRRFDVDCVALCIGNLPPQLPVDVRAMPADLGRYVANPWAADALSRIGTEDSVVLVGTGLTMVDVVLELRSRGHKGSLTALSRRGLVPVAHRDTQPYPPFLAAERLPTTVRKLFRAVRREVATAAQRGLDWRSVIDALRPQTQALWRNLALDERRRFLRHVRPYWEVHRHRVSPAVAAEIAELQRSGELSIAAARIVALEADDNGFSLRIRARNHDGVRHLSGNWLVNCSGPQLDYGRIGDPLIRYLFASGMARPDPLMLGLDVTDDYRLVDAMGAAAACLFALGPPIRGSLWETTAVPDIRKQCEALARHLAGVR